MENDYVVSIPIDKGEEGLKTSSDRSQGKHHRRNDGMLSGKKGSCVTFGTPV